MKIKNLLLALLALPLLFVGCKNSDPVVDETPEIKQPTVAVTAGEATENTITFTITSTDADKVAYVVVEGT
jgi:PBP1b-binding outer membrane lipoprotein LpoB